MKSKLLLLLLVLLTSKWPATAQTGRIAHFSHGGSMATLGAVEGVRDNLGIPNTREEEIIDSLVYQDNCSMTVYGRERAVRYEAGEDALRKAVWQPVKRSERYCDGYQSWQEAVQWLRQLYPQAKLIGFDKHRALIHKKTTNRPQTFQPRPFRYSYWRGLATVAALGAVGWLLDKKQST